MKTRLVLWGTEANDERVLVAIALDADANKVDIWTFPEQVATETLYNRLMNEWRLGRDTPFPNVFVQIERPLSASEPLLPEDLTVEHPELIQRAQTEWQFVVLSAKLFNTYHEELEHLHRKVEDLDAFDPVIWEEMKGYWEKVQAQIHEKNLFRDHGRKLKDKTNAVFAKLKELRRAMDDAFRGKSRERAAGIVEELEKIEDQIEKGLGLQPLFEELKQLQRRFRDVRLTRDDRSRLWQRIDKAFKAIKEKRYGPGYKRDFSPLERVKRRYDGLIAAIRKMKKSIDRDKRDVDVEDRKIEESEGQLEAQLREAKLKMIRERINSKEAKLAEMMKTKAELEERIAREESRAEERKEEEKEQEQIVQTTDAAKEKVAGDMREAQAADAGKAEDLQKAASAITGKDAVAKSADAEAGEEGGAQDESPSDDTRDQQESDMSGVVAGAVSSDEEE